MRINSRYNSLVDSAIFYAKELGIDHVDNVHISILKLPHPHSKQGYCEFPITPQNNLDITLFIKLDEEREITLAHEMVHVMQVIENKDINEYEAENLGEKLAKKRLTLTLLF